MQKSRTALVTGGARRIGAAIVQDLAADGFAVAIHCNTSADESEALARDIRKAGGRAAVVRADFSDAAQTASVIPSAVAALGPLDLLVNNASVFLKDDLAALDADTWDRQFSVNLRAPVFLASAFAAQLPQDVEGNIVNLVDQRVAKLTPEMPSYTLSKAALWAATQTMAQAYAPRLRVNGLAPGPTFPNPYAGGGGMGREISGVPLGRPVDVGDFGRAIRFLIETPSITGQLLFLDSGQHIGWRTPDIVDPPEP